MNIKNLVTRLNKNFNTCVFRPALQNWNYWSLYGSKINSTDVTPYFEHCGYTEFEKLQIYKNESYTMYLMRWASGSRYPEHLHPNERCLLKVIKGNLEETRYSKKETTKTDLSAGKVAYIDDTLGSHSMFCTNGCYTYSLQMCYEYNYKVPLLDVEKPILKRMTKI